MPAAIVSALPAAFAGAFVGVVLGLLLARPRAGEPALVDAVAAQLRSPLALLALPVPALVAIDAAGLPLLFAVTAFAPAFLHAFEGRRGEGICVPCILRGLAVASLLVAGVAAVAAMTCCGRAP